MSPQPLPAAPDRVAAFLESYEEAVARDGGADLADHLPPADHPLHREVLRELIRIDLEYGWGRGRPRPLADYRRRFPAAFRDAADRQAVAFEEYRLRLQAGEPATPDEYRRGYDVSTGDWPRPEELSAAGRDTSVPRSPPTEVRPVSPFATATAAEASLKQAARAYRQFRAEGGSTQEWGDRTQAAEIPVQVFRDLHAADPREAERVADAVVSLPEVGAVFLSFRLVRELGRGAFGRVFLAEQTDLAGRRVALKVSADAAGETRKQAQLQHTNIVPVYSLHQAGSLQAACMPYLGGTTLADVFAGLSGPALPTSGRHFASTLQNRHSTLTGAADSATAPPAADPADDGPPSSAVVLNHLSGLSYIEAVLWLAAQLADGLAHAHERGILHRDLKPANVLLTDDGQPMLLDFNLAHDTKLRMSLSAAVFGGTILYMSPEHIRAYQTQRGEVDARGDVYAFGLILFELLTGDRPHPIPPGRGRGVVDALLDSRLRPPPPLRPVNPAVTPAVEAIVHKCLEPDPGRRYQTARELQEDLRRQLDSRPLKYARDPSPLERFRKWRVRHPRLSSSGMMAAVAAVFLGGLLAAFVLRGRHLERLEAERTVARFRHDARGALFHLAHLADRDSRDRGVRRGRETLAVYGVLDDPHWRDRPAVRRLPDDERARLDEEVGELLMLLGNALLPTVADEGAVREALRCNDAALACYAPDRTPRAVQAQRADLLARLGEEAEARRAGTAAEGQELRTARDHYLAGKDHFDHGRYRQALPLFQKAADLDPRLYWAVFLQGRCHDQFGDHKAAAACYRTCLALEPDFGEAWYNCGLAHLRQKDYARAAECLDRAVERKPGWAEAYFNRALARTGLDRPADALADLDRAVELGCGPTRVYFLRARVRERTGDRDGAKRDRDEGLKREPADDLSWNARGFARLESDPAAALADFERALAHNPRSLPALENIAHVLSESLNRPKEAIAALDRAVALYPDHVPSRAGRGVLLARQGDRTAALKDAEESLLRNTDPPTLYQVAGIYALTSKQVAGDRLKALELLSAALRRGYGFDLLATDSDLDPIRATPEFQRLTAGAAALRPAPRKSATKSP